MKQQGHFFQKYFEHFCATEDPITQAMTAREAELTQQLEQALQVISWLQHQNQLLRQKVDLLVRRMLGASSEKLNSAQLELLQLSSALAAPPTLVTQPAQAPRATQPRSPKATRLPDSLPVVEEVIDPEPVKAQPEAWRCIGQEVSEQLDYEPGRFLKRRVVRRKYVQRTQVDSVPVIAPLPACLQERGLATLFQSYRLYYLVTNFIT